MLAVAATSAMREATIFVLLLCDITSIREVSISCSDDTAMQETTIYLHADAILHYVYTRGTHLH